MSETVKLDEEPESPWAYERQQLIAKHAAEQEKLLRDNRLLRTAMTPLHEKSVSDVRKLELLHRVATESQSAVFAENQMLTAELQRAREEIRQLRDSLKCSNIHEQLKPYSAFSEPAPSSSISLLKSGSVFQYSDTSHAWDPADIGA